MPAHQAVCRPLRFLERGGPSHALLPGGHVDDDQGPVLKAGGRALPASQVLKPRSATQERRVDRAHRRPWRLVLLPLLLRLLLAVLLANLDAVEGVSGGLLRPRKAADAQRADEVGDRHGNQAAAVELHALHELEGVRAEDLDKPRGPADSEEGQPRGGGQRRNGRLALALLDPKGVLDRRHVAPLRQNLPRVTYRDPVHGPALTYAPKTARM